MSPTVSTGELIGLFEALGGKVEVVEPVNPSSNLDEVKSARGQPSNPASRLAAALVPLTAN